MKTGGNLITADSAAFRHVGLNFDFFNSCLVDKARIQHATVQCPNHPESLKEDIH